jgi:cytidylate kinase
MPITIITGPPGAGKTTIASLLARRQTRAVHVLGDEFFHWIASGYIPPWMQSSGPQNRAVIQAIAAAADRFAEAGYEVFVDGIIGPWFLPDWQDAARFRDPPRYVILRPAREVAASRAVARDGHRDLVDPDPIAKMFAAFEDLGAFEEHVVDTTAHTTSETVRAVEQGLRAGSYVLRSRDRFDMERLATKFGTDLPHPTHEGTT